MNQKTSDSKDQLKAEITKLLIRGAQVMLNAADDGPSRLIIVTEELISALQMNIQLWRDQYKISHHSEQPKNSRDGYDDESAIITEVSPAPSTAQNNLVIPPPPKLPSDFEPIEKPPLVIKASKVSGNPRRTRSRKNVRDGKISRPTTIPGL